jgi:hypothetical protein
MRDALFEIEYVADVPIIVYPSGHCLVGNPGDEIVVVNPKNIIPNIHTARQLALQRLCQEMTSKPSQQLKQQVNDTV